MMLVEFPKLLTDAAWKKVEKAAGVSATGVGKTLRDAESAWRTLGTGIAGFEKGQVPPAKADAAKRSLIAAFHQSETVLQGLLPKVKSTDKKAILTDYGKVIAYLKRDLENSFNLLDDHRDKAFVIEKFNKHVKADLTAFKHRV
jgi:hypothetical protein